jgi:hypothetical protein
MSRTSPATIACCSTSGTTRLLFTPDPDKTFHRGATDYFSNGRQADIGAFDTPTFIGLELGYVTQLGDKWFEMTANEDLANSDGLNYQHKRVVHGLQANVVQRKHQTEDGTLWRVYPNEAMHTLEGLRVGSTISRNRDHAWEHALTKESATRHITIDAIFDETARGYALTLRDEDGISATAHLATEKQPAQHPEEAEQQVRKQLARFGSTEFELGTLAINWQQPWFVPNSALNGLRRDAALVLMAARLQACKRPERKAALQPPACYPEDTLSFLANVYNAAARSFYELHGVKLIAAAYEAHKENDEVSLMVTRHCIRYSLSLCPKQAKGVVGVQGQVRAEPMTLVNGSEKLTLRFDCKPCEMHVMGKMKKHIAKSAPPSIIPITFHPRRD